MSEFKDGSGAGLSKRQQRRQAARKYVYRAPTLADRLATLAQHAAALKPSAVAAQIRAGVDAYFEQAERVLAPGALGKRESSLLPEEKKEEENTNHPGAAVISQPPGPTLRIRCLALGSPTESGIAMYQLALLMLLAEWFSPSRRAACQQEKQQPQQQQKDNNAKQEQAATVETPATSGEDKPQDVEKISGPTSPDLDASPSPTSNSSSSSKMKKKQKSKEIKLTQLTPASGPGSPAPSYKSLCSYTPTNLSTTDPDNPRASWKLPLDVTVTTYDPVFSPEDHELFAALGITVSEAHGFVDDATTTTIVYSIHAPPFLTESVLAATSPSNNSSSNSARYVYIGNVLENYGTHLSATELRTRYPLIDAAVLSSPFPSSGARARNQQQQSTAEAEPVAATPWTWFPVPDALSANEPWMTAVNDLCVYWRNPQFVPKDPGSQD
ncbi:hypothetical protein D0Z00_001807 [Geotrichum galactomycetum]|uniref:Uncharacterized protein n=1 Tax=Geotrichum galactomycetum TaxID=27317 RepID=A0ACB6V619_9ASCO|nr:hypothetical protein D0Z00_001807 [Geotrichum candidum]